jgi:hypothetical protein
VKVAVKGEFASEVLAKGKRFVASELAGGKVRGRINKEDAGGRTK